MESGLYLDYKKKEHLSTTNANNKKSIKKNIFQFIAQSTIQNTIPVFTKNIEANQANHRKNDVVHSKNTEVEQKLGLKNTMTNNSEEKADSTMRIDKTFKIIKSASIETEELLQNHIEILKTQLKNAGLQPINEIVPYEVGKEYLKEAYLKLSQENSIDNLKTLEKWDSFIINHPKYKKEKEDEYLLWLNKETESNKKAFDLQKTLIPSLSEISLQNLTNSGLTNQLARRILDNKVLCLIHRDMDYIEKIHIADLMFRYSFVNLDIIELRALYYCLPEFKTKEDKLSWKQSIFIKLERMIKLEENNSLAKHQKRNIAYLKTNHSLSKKNKPMMKSKFEKSINSSSSFKNKIALLDSLIQKKR